MRRGLHGLALIPSDILTDIEVARAAGYEVAELYAPNLARYLDHGHSAEELGRQFGSLQPHLIAAVENVDLPESSARDLVVAFTRRMCQAAKIIGCPYLQMVSSRFWESQTWSVIRRETGRGLRELAGVCAEYDVRIAYEPLAWLPVHSLEQALEVIGEAAHPNIAMVVDTFHIFAGGGRDDTIRNLDPRVIATIHLSDAGLPRFDQWSDDERYPMPGDGVIPLRRLVNMILETGYDGVITDEMSSNRYAYLSRLRFAVDLKARGDSIIRDRLRNPESNKISVRIHRG